MKKKVVFLLVVSLIYLSSCNPWVRLSYSNWIDINILNIDSLGIKKDSLILNFSFNKDPYLKSAIFYIIPQISNSLNDNMVISLDTFIFQSKYINTNYEIFALTQKYNKTVILDSQYINKEFVLKIKYNMFFKGEYATWYDKKYFEVIEKKDSILSISKKIMKEEDIQLQINYRGGYFSEEKMKFNFK